MQAENFGSGYFRKIARGAIKQGGLAVAKLLFDHIAPSLA
jgi:hypothetical protein